MKKALFLSCLLTLAGYPVDLQAQIGLGVQGNWAEDYDFGIGARATVQLPVDQFPLVFVGSFDWFLPEGDEIDDYWEINANLVTRPTLRIVTAYMGLGLNLAHVLKPDPFGGPPISETKAGLNILAGLIYDALVRPYSEVRYEVEGGRQVVVTVGIGISHEAFTGIR